MNEIKKDMITKAEMMYKEIHPCSSKLNIGDCFTTEGDMVVFWFNTPDQSTHVLTASIS